MNKEILSDLTEQLFQARLLLDGIHQKLSQIDQSKQTALLFGLNYPETEYSLNGCVNDVVLMSSKLQSKFKYGAGEIHMKTDLDLMELDILDYLKDVIKNLSCGDKLFFHYSGHGLQVWDMDGDEIDNKDEAIFTHHGVVTDDRISEVLSMIPEGVKVFLIFDCCNSGSIADLPYQYKNSSTHTLISNKKFSADIVTLSGSRDDQTSADAWIAERKGYYGALTSSLIGLVDSENILNLSWMELAVKIQTQLKNKGYTQIPQICASRKELLDEKVWW